MSTTFGKTHKAIERIVETTALQSRVARAIVRKSGIRPTSILPGEAGGVRTVIDAYMGSGESPYARQYPANLTLVTRARLVSRSNVAVYVFYSEMNTGEYAGPVAPDNYAPLRDASFTRISASENSPAGLGWVDLHESAKIPLRLTLSTDPDEITLNGLGGPFAVALQVA